MMTQHILYLFRPLFHDMQRGRKLSRHSTLLLLFTFCIFLVLLRAGPLIFHDGQTESWKLCSIMGWVSCPHNRTKGRDHQFPQIAADLGTCLVCSCFGACFQACGCACLLVSIMGLLRAGDVVC